MAWGEGGVQRVRAYAKVNLGLDVLGSRGDGYHRIDSIFQCIDLHDDIIFCDEPRIPAGRILLTVDHPDVPTGEDNLILRAARSFEGVPGMRIMLRKRIPVGGGLGGGSSDAASTLSVMEDIAPPAGKEEIARRALELGADVPFFLSGGTARISGIGERIFPLPDPAPHWVLILSPPISCDTALVYRAYDSLGPPPDKARSIPGVSKALAEGGLEGMLGEGTNDLQRAAYAVYPALRDFAESMAGRLGRPMVLSGTGSSFFAVYRHYDRVLWDWSRLRWDLAARGARAILARFRFGAGWEVVTREGDRR
ncbi:MAG: 4-(cytidine 5'-diphospho)-2-C-methyl-D-erythritol kinase [Clostridia bacterium]